MKTKIICTIGPASESEEMLEKLIRAGMNVARVNCSHGSIQQNEETINRIKVVRKRLDVSLAIMLDTKGPDIRIGKFEGTTVNLCAGQDFTFTTEQIIGDNTRVSVTCEELYKAVKPGQLLLLNDGFVKMTVVAVTDTEITAKVNVSGRLSDRKSLYAPCCDLNMSFISKEDEEDFLLAIRTDVDYIAASFVNSAKNVTDIKEFLARNGMEIPIISKIESSAGVADIDNILKVSDGIMIARGDLGVEYPIEQIPTIQKLLAQKAVKTGKFVITATEMLESMIEKSRPTRAETTDVANAIYDGTSCIMLSAETSVGKYPIEAVDYMRRIAEEAEVHVRYDDKFYHNDVTVDNQKEAFANTITGASIAAKAKAIVIFTDSGGTAIRVSKYHPRCPIYAFARNEKVFHQMAMISDIIPISYTQGLSVEQMLKMSNDYILGNGLGERGEIIVVNASYKGSDTDLVLIHPLA